MTEDEMVGWHHQLNGHAFGRTLGVGDGQGGLACCGPWGRTESRRLRALTLPADKIKESFSSNPRPLISHLLDLTGGCGGQRPRQRPCWHSWRAEPTQGRGLCRQVTSMFSPHDKPRKQRLCLCFTEGSTGLRGVWCPG